MPGCPQIIILLACYLFTSRCGIAPSNPGYADYDRAGPHDMYCMVNLYKPGMPGPPQLLGLHRSGAPDHMRMRTTHADEAADHLPQPSKELPVLCACTHEMYASHLPSMVRCMQGADQCSVATHLPNALPEPRPAGDSLPLPLPFPGLQGTILDLNCTCACNMVM